ncbi:hypothetical protein PGT21_030287 [Puccinia graminis f. sp. tritici]|uniref:Thioesterase domain-containing protein n=1 Tax=Puccinia graminis f. sp. tritici TaxID=56615 RepID=A0A5B0PZ48_PUCGR|nr:hypothetical protein PGT21_030287 [Puccinia graminis f. sp. tritici]KAA1109226.1 hypothetical protein PGTUg99_019673 [Puccinia graminis f. sp. tritici]
MTAGPTETEARGTETGKSGTTSDGSPSAGRRERKRGTKMSEELARFRPRPSTILVSLLALRYGRPGPSRGAPRRLLHWLALWLAVVNWRILPFYWHAMTLLFPILKAKLRRWKLGSSTPAFVANLHVLGKSPFQARIVSKHCATWNTCDFMFHMSNSAYAIALDEARAIWQIQMIGAAMRADHERVRPMIASTHFTYFAEIPILADFEVEFRPVAWDHKWLYLLATFTTDPPKGSQTRPLNCLSITRMVNKIGRRTVRPEKLMALSGLGMDPSEWETLSRLRIRTPDPATHHPAPPSNTSHLNPAQEWLVSSDPFEPFQKYEALRTRNLEIIRAGLDGDLKIGAERLKEL